MSTPEIHSKITKDAIELVTLTVGVAMTARIAWWCIDGITKMMGWR